MRIIARANTLLRRRYQTSWTPLLQSIHFQGASDQVLAGRQKVGFEVFKSAWKWLWLLNKLDGMGLSASAWAQSCFYLQLRVCSVCGLFFARAFCAHFVKCSSQDYYLVRACKQHIAKKHYRTPASSYFDRYYEIHDSKANRVRYLISKLEICLLIHYLWA